MRNLGSILWGVGILAGLAIYGRKRLNQAAE
jgi:hypothetical protein